MLWCVVKLVMARTKILFTAPMEDGFRILEAEDTDTKILSASSYSWYHFWLNCHCMLSTRL